MTSDSNAYSSTWFELFLRPVSPSQTDREIAFLTRHLPLEQFKTILDLCCGEGRHARELIPLGYAVTGIDANEHALAVAKQSIGAAANWLRGDMRNLATLTNARRFNAVLCLWQSFGYFDDAANQSILKEMTRSLAPHGRLILDLYNRTFFQANQGTRTLETADGKKVAETKELIGNRLRVRLSYESTAQVDQFDWQLITADELRDLAGTMGLRTLVTCSQFDETSPASAAIPRMQLVFER